MKKLDLWKTTRKQFAYRPDDAYTLDEVYEQFQRWGAEVFQCRRGEICLKAGSPATQFMLVVSGIVHVMQPSEIGDDILVRVASNGEYLGLPLLFTQEKVHPYDVVVASKAEVVLFKVDEVRKWRTDPKSQPLYNFIGQLMGNVIHEAQTRALILSGQDIAERLRRWLAVQVERGGSRTVPVPGTCADLAKYLGVNRSALSRTIRNLRTEGKIEFKRNVFVVLGG